MGRAAKKWRSVVQRSVIWNIQSGVSGRWLLVCSTLLVLVDIARGEGTYQRTRNGKTFVWNNHPQPGDVATWSGGRDREEYARGFGQLTWYTKEPGFTKPQLYARYWGNMVGGKFDGPVNVHSKRKTHYAIFIEGARVTRWAAGTAPSQATAQWRVLVAKRRAEREPESPAEGPSLSSGVTRPGGPSRTGVPGSSWNESIQDLWSEHWPVIDIDDSLRLLVFPPRSLRIGRDEE